jgi:WhiB family redox-sensing transcriptional regulator
MAMTAREQFDRRPWQASAACTGENAALFYPPLRTENKANRLTRERRAKVVCHSCPVRAACLEHAVDSDERYGIWGGLTNKERRLAATHG